MTLNTFKKLTSLLTLTAVFSGTGAWAVLDIPTTNITGISSFITRACTLAGWFFTFIMIIAIVMILVAAFFFLTAGDNATTRSKAKDFLLYAIVGIIIAIMPYPILAIVSTFFGAGTINPC
ncbi:MAG: hypothetical protein A3A80_03290 [Candidatus Terrybacteria bacterium RIFCSPLOWO2_01_FULL_44_24]|uniref:Uncharacterized protein n=1 Tax=Candidatus Terrybacteria bacterium RIFCSPHIGHO2_01_FULL_43_35 TaxID=1802361 RepID=A0A1G2PDY5_9BACT|nr:MAG: hypothetical protein A2828_00810 [Candidatus Terrybacteria bacterium RIFCSPHIGHO2_01_FULL_43_35]OHA51154.1 MAG: hypothetical protein A3A80_03290 [Candidatus Terrybacteria bacterium RIFCSPLOWO2_01_FULL_44_24]